MGLTAPRVNQPTWPVSPGNSTALPASDFVLYSSADAIWKSSAARSPGGRGESRDNVRLRLPVSPGCGREAPLET